MDKFFVSLLTVIVVLFVLKLVGAIAWSWWWIITTPLWVPIVLILFGISVLLIVVSFAALFDGYKYEGCMYHSYFRIK